MNAKSRKVLNCLTKLGGWHEVFDLSIAIKMTEDTVQSLLGELKAEGAVSSRVDGNKELWSAESGEPAAARQPAPEPGEAAGGKKKAKATAAGPDDRFDEFILDPGAAAKASPAPSPAPIRPEPETSSFEPADAGPAADAGNFEPKPAKKEKRAKAGDADFEPVPKKEKPPKSKPADETFESKTARETRAERELSAGPDDHFDEFAERVPSKPNLPIPLMAGAAALILIVILFILGGGGGKSKKIQAKLDEFKTEMTAKLDSLKTETTAKINKLEDDNKVLSNRVKALEADVKKTNKDDARKPAANQAKPKQGARR